MTPAPAIHGIIAYPITPFNADGGVDTAKLTVLVEKLVTAGVHAIAPLGIDMDPELLVEMFNDIDNLAMVKSPPETRCRSTPAATR